MVDPIDAGILLLFGALLATALVAARRRDVAALVNALASLAAALSPAAVGAVLGTGSGPTGGLGPELTIWIASAGVLHMLGMLGLYESTRWWDFLTHAVSAALVAALLYAGVIVTVHETVDGGLQPSVVGAMTVLFTVTAGVFWELVELVARDLGERYDIDPVLVHYGWRDTAFDLVFDIVGAAIVVGFDLRTFVPIAEKNPEWTARLVLWSGGLLGIGSVLLLLGLRFIGGGWLRAE